MAARRKALAYAVGIGSILGIAAFVFFTGAYQPTTVDPSLNYSPVPVDSSMSTAPLVKPGATPQAKTDVVDVGEQYFRASTQGVTTAPVSLTLNATLVADVAIEADYEFYLRMNSDLSRAESYIYKLMGAVSNVYARDINVRLRPSFVRIATTPADPWTATNTSDALMEVQRYWMTNERNRPRALVLFLSGKPLGGGRAFRPGLCSADFGYAVAGDIEGAFTQSPGFQTWDLVVTAHELGHTFGSKHSHCYHKASGPWYDQCYTGEDGCYSGEVVPSKGTVMSYCLNSPPYMSNIDPIAFRDASDDPAIANAMRALAESLTEGNPGGCLGISDKALFIPLVN